MRKNHKQRAGKTRLGQPGLQAPKIRLDHRTHRGIGDGGRKTFELLDLRQHLSRGRNVGMLQPLARRRGDRLLVFRILPRMQQADRHRLHIFRRQPVQRRVQRTTIERDLHRAIRAHAFAYPKAQVPRHQRGRRRHPQIVTLGLQSFAHLDNVAMALGGQHPHARRLAFQQRVGRDRRAVHDTTGLPEQRHRRQMQRRGSAGDAVQHPIGLVARRGGCLGENRCTIRAGNDNVGKSAPDIDADRVAHATTPSTASLARAAGSRRAGSPHPPPPPDSTWITLPGGITTPTSLLFSLRGGASGASSV